MSWNPETAFDKPWEKEKIGGCDPRMAIPMCGVPGIMVPGLTDLWQLTPPWDAETSVPGNWETDTPVADTWTAANPITKPWEKEDG